MSNIHPLGTWLRRFLCEHIVTERNLARNTQQSYRDTFTLLLPFVSRTLGKPVDRLTVHHLTVGRVLRFLTYLENDRGCSVQTRNQRLAAIRSFARFVGSRDPVHVEWCGSIRAIGSKKATPQPLTWLTNAEVQALLDVSDCTTLRGRTEYALLPTVAAHRTRVGRVGRWSRGWRCRLPQPLPKTAYPVRDLPPRAAVCGLCARVGREENHAACVEAYDRLSPGACGRGPQHHPCLARPCEPQYDQYLCRNRP